MLHTYLPILIFLIVAAAMAAFIFVASRIIAKFLKVNQPTADKLSPYECGFEEFENARLPFDVKFYLVALLFIVFDLEVAFLFPFAVVMKHLAWPGIAAMILFLALLVVGFIYEWKKGALEWE